MPARIGRCGKARKILDSASMSVKRNRNARQIVTTFISEYIEIGSWGQSTTFRMKRDATFAQLPMPVSG